MTSPDPTPRPASHDQAQFLDVLSREAAIAAFVAALRPAPLGAETVPLADAPGRVTAQDIAAPVDTPPFDRSVVDGFAVRAADLEAASPARPLRLALNAEVIACGTAPTLTVTPGTATPIATGGPIPRGADAVIMIEHTAPDGVDAITVARAVSPGSFISFAGSDIARGQTLLAAGTLISAREIGMLAAVGLAAVPVWRRPRVAVISTGDELVAPGDPLRPAAVYDSNGPVIAAALEENGCTPVRFGAIPDDLARLRAAITQAHATCDGVVLSGGTSKGAGDLTTQVIAELGRPGIVAHGVALKPGKPLCLAVCDGKPVVVLPGFPTSAMFTFHDIVAPVLRRLAGLPPREDATLEARIPVRVASEPGRTEFVMVALTRDAAGLVAHPVGKGSGAVTAFAQADGFVAIEALADHLPAGVTRPVQLFSPRVRVPDLVIIGSHCVGLDAVVAALAASGFTARVLAAGSLGGLQALRRGEADIAPFHLVDPKTGLYNTPFLTAGQRLVPGWRRPQGVVFRPGDARLEGRTAVEAIAALGDDPSALMVNRNPGAGTRTLIDTLLDGRKPPGYWNQPRSHNAVAAAVAQGRADWGVAIRPVADAFGLGFLPLADEHYDFAIADPARAPAALAAFEAAVVAAAPALVKLGFVPVVRPDWPHLPA